ncbi:hypothetical protein B0H13DRAFT_2305987 [Mycena leptocephala]|nr:hypothetical protein B0H13DRAFT_2305987 [Mycena leptocephala]
MTLIRVMEERMEVPRVSMEAEVEAEVEVEVEVEVEAKMAVVEDQLEAEAEVEVEAGMVMVEDQPEAQAVGMEAAVEESPPRRTINGKIRSQPSSLPSSPFSPPSLPSAPPALPLWPPSVLPPSPPSPPPSAAGMEMHGKQRQKQTGFQGTVGFTHGPTGTANFSHNRTNGATLEATDNKVMPKCYMRHEIGHEWNKDNKSYSSYNMSYQAQNMRLDIEQTDDDPLEVKVGMGINLRPAGSEKPLPQISFVNRNQVLIWIVDPTLKAPIRGIMVLLSSYIDNIKTEPTLSILEEADIELGAGTSNVTRIKPEEGQQGTISLSTNAIMQNRIPPALGPQYLAFDSSLPLTYSGGIMLLGGDAVQLVLREALPPAPLDRAHHGSLPKCGRLPRSNVTSTRAVQTSPKHIKTSHHPARAHAHRPSCDNAIVKKQLGIVA